MPGVSCGREIVSASSARLRSCCFAFFKQADFSSVAPQPAELSGLLLRLFLGKLKLCDWVVLGGDGGYDGDVGRWQGDSQLEDEDEDAGVKVCWGIGVASIGVTEFCVRGRVLLGLDGEGQRGLFLFCWRINGATELCWDEMGRVKDEVDECYNVSYGGKNGGCREGGYIVLFCWKGMESWLLRFWGGSGWREPGGACAEHRRSRGHVTSGPRATVKLVSRDPVWVTWAEPESRDPVT
eukprot:65848-Rhodomonas_salina.1